MIDWRWRGDEPVAQWHVVNAEGVEQGRYLSKTTAEYVAKRFGDPEKPWRVEAIEDQG